MKFAKFLTSFLQNTPGRQLLLTILLSEPYPLQFLFFNYRDSTKNLKLVLEEKEHRELPVTSRFELSAKIETTEQKI